MKFPTMEEMAKDVAEKALDEYIYEDKTIRQWVEILKDYDDKQSTLKRIVEKLEIIGDIERDVMGGRTSGRTFASGFTYGIESAIEIVKEETR